MSEEMTDMSGGGVGHPESPRRRAVRSVRETLCEGGEVSSWVLGRRILDNLESVLWEAFVEGIRWGRTGTIREVTEGVTATRVPERGDFDKWYLNRGSAADETARLMAYAERSAPTREQIKWEREVRGEWSRGPAEPYPNGAPVRPGDEFDGSPVGPDDECAPEVTDR